jgi:hypothetical protein
MTPHERIIRNALDAASAHGAEAGEGGKAIAKIYRECDGIEPIVLLTMIGIMANRLADQETE